MSKIENILSDESVNTRRLSFRNIFRVCKAPGQRLGDTKQLETLYPESRASAQSRLAGIMRLACGTTRSGETTPSPHKAYVNIASAPMKVEENLFPQIVRGITTYHRVNDIPMTARWLNA